MARFDSFIGPSYTSQSRNSDAEKTVNLYVEVIESGKGKSPAALYPTPGLDAFCTLSGTSVRGLCRIISGTTERVFAVSGTDFVELLSNGTTAVRGTVASDSVQASMAASRNQVVIISAGVAYYFTLATNTFAAIAGMLGTPIQVGYTDGYFIVLLKQSEQFQISALLDAVSWDGLDTAIVSVFADNVVSMIIDHRELWLLGENQSQVYYDSGNADFPFDVIPGAFIEEGCAAAWATVKIDNSLFWIGSSDRGNGIAWRAQGYTPHRVSNHAVEYAWKQYSTISDAIAYSYEDQGHPFWVIYFPTADATWVYDVATEMWHERGFWLPAGNRYEAHHSRCHVYAFGKHLVGDWKSGKVYEMSINLFDDDGSMIRRLRRCPHISNEQKRQFYSQLQIDLEVGLGLVVGQGYDPQVIMRFSNDGSKTWSNDYFTSAGKIGEYKRRVIYRRLGVSRDRVFEISLTDPIPWRIANAYLEFQSGTGS